VVSETNGMELQLCGMELSDLEKQRYKKHLQLEAVGLEGQLKLKRGRVLVVGAGGLGSPVLMYLAAAGIGSLSIMDDDVVSFPNLQRQVLHTTPMVGTTKVASAYERLQQMNPEVNLYLIPERLQAANAYETIFGYQVVVDCTDNLAARLLINDACVRASIPFVYGAVFEFEGQVSVFDAKRGPCLRCMLPEQPAPESIPNPEIHGLLSTVPGVIGLLQATEVIKLLTGIGDDLVGILALYDALGVNLKKIRVPKRANCPVCGLTA